MRSMLKVFTVIGMVLGMVMISSPALAHQVTVYQGKDRAFVRYGYSCTPGPVSGCEHRKIFIDDNECDGNGAWVHYQLEDGTYWTFNDEGCNDPTSWTKHGKLRVIKFRVIEKSNGNPVYTTPWKHVGVDYAV